MGGSVRIGFHESESEGHDEGGSNGARGESGVASATARV